MLTAISAESHFWKKPRPRRAAMLAEQQQQQAAAQPLPPQTRRADAGVAQRWASAGCACGHPHCQEFFGGCDDPPGSWGPGCWGPRSPEWEEVWVKELLDAQLALVGEQAAAGVSCRYRH